MAIEVTYRSRNPRFVIKATGETPKDVFGDLASMAEILDASEACGKCGCTEIAPRVRRIEEDVFYEAKCTASDCGATLGFGQSRKGGFLFPKRKDEEKKWMPNKGWTIYSAGGNQQQDTRQSQAPRPGAPPAQGRAPETRSNRW